MVKNKKQNTFMIVIEKTIFSKTSLMEMNMTETIYKTTMKEVNKIVEEETCKGNVVEVWKLVKRC